MPLERRISIHKGAILLANLKYLGPATCVQAQRSSVELSGALHNQTS